MPWFAIASLTPAAMIALACLRGGAFSVAALASMTALALLMDRLNRVLPPSEGSGRALSVLLALLHFPLLALTVWALGAGPLGLADKAAIYVAAGLYLGQVSNANAHELIHARSRLPRRLGAAVYISLLHGHHVSAHLKVHHVHAATDRDPNSAAAGTGFWAYAPRAAVGEFRAGLHAEAAHRARARRPRSRLSHPYLAYVGGALGGLIAAFALAGLGGVIALLALAAYAQLQLFLSDYVQHYGLRRAIGPDGRAEPVGPQHSWNAPQWYSSAMMLNAPRHSDHHMRPDRAYPALEVTPDSMPMLPRALPVMATLALCPPLWRRVMDRRVARWRDAA